MMAQLNLYCAEDCWDDGDDFFTQQEESLSFCRSIQPSHHLRLLPQEYSNGVYLPEDQLAWDGEELVSLAIKERTQKMVAKDFFQSLRNDSSLASARREAVEWVLSVTAHYGFTAHTAVVAVDFLDWFLSSLQFQKETPWMTQLAAVACLSLAAKVEETQVPLLLDLQIQETQFVFEAKTIQRMELLVLSALDWKLHPVTPLSFIDHIVRRLGLKNHRHWEFFRRCEQLMLGLLGDWRLLCYMPSVVAASVMIYVINQLEPFNPQEYENQLLGVMEMSNEDVKDCLQLIKEDSSMASSGEKRKILSPPSSPRGVFDALFNSEASNGPWVSSSSLASSPMDSPQKASKKGRL